MESLNGNSNLLISGKGDGAFVHQGKVHSHAVHVQRMIPGWGLKTVALQAFETIEEAEAYRQRKHGGLIFAKIISAGEAIEILRKRWKEPHELVG